MSSLISSRLFSEQLSSLAEQLGAYRLNLSRPFDRLLLRTWPFVVLAGRLFTSAKSSPWK